MIEFTEKTVSRQFRDSLAIALPNLGSNKAYWRMMQYILFGTWRDENTDALLLPREIVAAIEGKTCDSNYSALRFLERFQEDVGIDLEISDYRYTYDPELCKPRCIKSISLPKHIKEIVDEERRSISDDRVWMGSGKTWLRKHAVDLRKSDRDEAASRSNLLARYATNDALLGYLNTLPPNRFTSSLKYLPAAFAAAEKLSDAKNQMNLLMAIRDQSQPFYMPVEKTTRIYSLRESILRLHRDLRKIMTQDWITADLKSAQLAIVAKVWGIPSLTLYLQSGQSIWPDLCRHMGLSYDAENKAIIKGALYAVIFGAGKHKMKSYFSRYFVNGTDAYTLFKSHTVIRSLILARSKQLKMIRQASGGTDAFGNFTPLVEKAKSGYDFLFDNSRSILACIAQSYELKLLMPVIQLAISAQLCDHGFTITTWLHDGFTFDCHHYRDRGYWQSHLAEVVKAEANRLGIVTELEF